ncbi:nucleotidyltransferase family protein [Thermodesulfovibrio sp.]|uniref:nucleotidyltransferase family protein n=1 Tax=Thermodesulfovibrio sp. TaxID=2067987 RepID=UPI0030B7B571
MKTLSEIAEILQEKKELLREKYKVKEIGVFGSYVRGEQKESSDVDILVDFEKPVSLLKIVSLENYLSDLIGIKVEVVPKRDIRSELRESILREAVLL